MEKTYKILKLILLVLSLTALLLGAYLLYNKLDGMFQIGALATEPEQEAGETTPAAIPAPDFTVYDAEGNAYKLSDFEGKPVILNFWASWCGPCKSEMPDFEKKYQEYGEDIHFLMVNLTDGNQETVESASGYIRSQKFTFPVYFDTAVEGAMAYGVNSVPVTYFIDAEGNLVTRGMGALPAEVLQQGIDILLNP